MIKGTFYPLAVDPSMIGTYPANCSIGKHVCLPLEEVLEYRVWVLPKKGHISLQCFASFGDALEFAMKTEHAKWPTILMDLTHFRTGDYPHPIGEFAPYQLTQMQRESEVDII